MKHRKIRKKQNGQKTAFLEILFLRNLSGEMPFCSTYHDELATNYTTGDFRIHCLWQTRGIFAG